MDERSLLSGGIEVLLPKFTVTHRLTLDAVLKEMGVTDAFDPREADFSGMDGRAGWLNIGSVLHQAFVIVDEEGTEAAAATSGGGCFPSGTVVLTADGARPIEKIESGTRVASCDPATGAWTLAT
jgi:serpin B